MKKVIPVLIFILLVFTCIPYTKIFASDHKQRIYDFAALLTEEEIQELEALSNKYSAKRNTDIIILTTKNTEGRDVVEYMEDFYDKQALGYDQPYGNTAILTLDMEHREVYVAGFYRAEKYLDNDRCEQIRIKITPDLSSGNYSKAFYSFIKISYRYMGIRPGMNPDNPFFHWMFQLFISILIAGVSVGIMTYNTGGKMTVNANTYLNPKKSKIIQSWDHYIRSSVTRHRKPSNNTSSSGGIGGGGGGISSGGHSHSGSRGSF